MWMQFLLTWAQRPTLHCSHCHEVLHLQSAECTSAFLWWPYIPMPLPCRSRSEENGCHWMLVRAWISRKPQGDEHTSLLGTSGNSAVSAVVWHIFPCRFYCCWLKQYPQNASTLWCFTFFFSFSVDWMGPKHLDGCVHSSHVAIIVSHSCGPWDGDPHPLLSSAIATLCHLCRQCGCCCKVKPLWCPSTWQIIHNL